MYVCMYICISTRPSSLSCQPPTLPTSPSTISTSFHLLLLIVIIIIIIVVVVRIRSLWQGLLLVPQSTQVEVGVRAVAFHTDYLQISPKISRVQSRNR